VATRFPSARGYLRGRNGNAGGDVKKFKARLSAKTTHPPNVGRRKVILIGQLRKYIDPGPPEEAEKFVQLIYEERRQERERA